MADERLKVEAELNQTGNAAQSLERTVGLLDRAVEAERKLASMAGQAEAAMTRLGGAAGGLSRADEAINRERSRSSPVGTAFSTAAGGKLPSATTERAYEAFRRDQALVASATGRAAPLAPSTSTRTALLGTAFTEPAESAGRTAPLMATRAMPASLPAPSSVLSPTAKTSVSGPTGSLEQALGKNTRAVEQHTITLTRLHGVSAQGQKPGQGQAGSPAAAKADTRDVERSLAELTKSVDRLTGALGVSRAAPAPLPADKASGQAKKEAADQGKTDWSLHSQRERQQIENKERYANEVRLHGQSGADTRLRLRETAQLKDRASAAMPQVSGMFGEGAAAGLMKLAGPIGAAVAGAETFKKGLDEATRTITIFSNSSLTGAQKMERFSEGLPVVGRFVKSIREFGEAVSGTTELLRKLGIEREVANLRRERTADIERQRGATGAEVRGAEAVVTASKGTAQFADYKRVDKDQVGGDVRYREESMRREAADAEVRARREAHAKKTERAGQDTATDQRFMEVARQRQRLSKADEAVKRMRTKEDMGVRDKGGMQKALQEQEAAQKDLGQAEVRYQEELNRLKQAGVEAKKAEYAAGQAVLNQSKAELEILKMKEQRMVSAQQRLGGMHRGERVMALQAVKQIKQHGIENASPQMIQWAERAAPEMVKKLQERVGGKELEKWQKELEGVKGHAGKSEEAIQDDFQEFKGENLKEIRQKIEVQQQNIRVEAVLNEEKLARAVAQELGRIGELIDKIKVEARDRVRQEVDNKQQMRNNAG